MRTLAAAALLALPVAGIAAPALAVDDAPVTRCGDAVYWAVDDTYANRPGVAGLAVAWAYGQVAPVAGLRAQPARSDVDVMWEWQARGSGSGYLPGESYEDGELFGDDEWWTHAVDGEQPVTEARARTTVIRDVLTDLGVRRPVSDAAGLAPADRRALRAICAAQAKTGDTADGGQAEQPAVAGPGEWPEPPEPTAAPAWADAASGPVLVAIGLAVLLFLAKPDLAGRLKVRQFAADKGPEDPIKE